MPCTTSKKQIAGLNEENESAVRIQTLLYMP